MPTPSRNRQTPRPRWLALFEGGRPDRLPTDYWATGEFHAKLKRHLGVADDEALYQRLGIDAPRTVWPRERRRPHADPAVDRWGLRTQRVDYGTGVYHEVVEHPLATATTVEEIHAYPWPSPDDYDYAAVTEQLARDDGTRLIRGGHYEPFLTCCSLRGMEQAYEDLLLNPDIAHALLGHLFDFHHEYNRRIFEAADGRIDLFYLAEDLGGQTGPLFSVDVYRTFLLPGQKKMADLCRAYGVRVFYHTDGSARPFLPDLVDTVGIDVLNPLQWRCPGMELEPLARDYGGRIAFHGGIDNQQTLPFGTPDDVRAQVREVAGKLAGCRWVCAPCHNIQAVTPVENVVAMYEAAASLPAT